MRYVFGIAFIVLFVGFAGCTILLGGPPSQVYALRDIYLGGALVCFALSAVTLGLLVLGAGAKGRKISSWGVPLLCLAALLASFALGALLLNANPLGSTPEHLALELRIRICAYLMIAFGLFSLGSLIVSVILAKKHNAKPASAEG